MKYKSELIKDIVDTGGHKKSSLHYESECIGTWIEETKGAYPKLCDYESEWLNYISILDDKGGSEEPEPEPPIGEFPYVALTDVTNATIDNVVPLAYKSAILYGKSETIDGTLQSVKMPVLTTSNEDGTKRIILSTPSDLELRGIGDERDELDCLTGEVVTRIKELNLKEITNWWMYKNSEINETVAFYFNVSTFMKNYVSNPNSLLCNSLPVAVGDTVASSGYECIAMGGAFLKIRIAKSKLSEISTNGLINYLKQNDIIIVGYSASESIKTVELSIQDQDGKTLRKIKPIEGTMHITTSGTPINPTVSLEVPVEAITQNLSSFIGEE